MNDPAAIQLDSLYRNRFEATDRADKRVVWSVLCEQVFSRYVALDATVLEVGAGYCELINNLSARRRIAVDANPELSQHVGPGVEAHCTFAQELTFLADASVDVAFASNFFEHLPDKTTLSQVVRELRRVLKPGGRLVVMGPNIRYLPGAYWDYYDHHLALTEKSVAELLRLTGFEIELERARFLPYTVKSILPKWRWLVRAYLLIGPPAFALFGKQFLVVGRAHA